MTPETFTDAPVTREEFNKMLSLVSDLVLSVVGSDLVNRCTQVEMLDKLDHLETVSHGKVVRVK